jgi:phage shock protein A
VGLWRRVLALIQSKRESADIQGNTAILFDRADHQQRQMLWRLRAGIVDVATAVEELEREATRLRAATGGLDERARRAVVSGRTDLARIALERKRLGLHELATLDEHLATVKQTERELLAAHQQLSLQMEQLRRRRTVWAARRTAAETHIEITRAVTGLTGELRGLGFAIERAEHDAARLQVRAQALASLMGDEMPVIGLSAEDAFERALRAAEDAHSIAEERTTILDELRGHERPTRELSTGEDAARCPS